MSPINVGVKLISDLRGFLVHSCDIPIDPHDSILLLLPSLLIKQICLVDINT